MADGHTPAPAGHNGPPADDAFTAIRLHCDELYERASPWLTGAPITTDEQAAEVERFLDDARAAAKAADDARVEENKPFDEGKAAVQQKYGILIANTKTAKGTMVRLQEVCKAALTPWRTKKAQEAATAAEAARKEAEEQAAAAAKAAREAAGDLEATEAAETLVQQAQDAQRDANRATKAATTGTGLRTVWVATMTDQKAASLHYMREQPAEFIALAQRLADIDARNGKRQIAGFDVTPEKRAV